MANWIQKLETAWWRRYVRDSGPLPEDQGKTPVCVITGGSEGIGRHLANEFSARGHALLLIARTATVLETAAAELRRDYPVKVYTASIDLTQPEPEKAVAAALEANALYAEILVNNAGIGIGGAFLNQDPARIEALCKLNVEALTALTRTFLPGMLRRGRGGILNLCLAWRIVPRSISGRLLRIEGLCPVAHRGACLRECRARRAHFCCRAGAGRHPLP